MRRVIEVADNPDCQRNKLGLPCEDEELSELRLPGDPATRLTGSEIIYRSTIYAYFFQELGNAENFKATSFRRRIHISVSPFCGCR
jgi:hypothetical protein